MRNLKSKPFLVLAFSLIAIAMSGCGKSNTAAAIPPTGYGQYGIPGNYGSGTTGACMPIAGGVLQFQGSFAVDSANVVTTQYSSGQQVPGGIPAQFMSYPACLPTQIPSPNQPCSASGFLQMNLTPVAYLSPTAKLGVGTGLLQLSQNMMATLAAYGNTCATVVGVNLGRTSGNTLYGGTVTVLINGSQQLNLPF